MACLNSFFRWGIFCLLMCLGGSVWAQEDEARAWTTFRQEDGLAHNVVTAVTQTPDGAMWFSTFGGVSRYDGRNWETFTTQTGLPSNMVWDLVADDDGDVWAGMGGGFIGEVKQAVARYRDGQWRGFDTPESLFGRFGVRKFFASRPEEAFLITDDGRLLLFADGKLRLVQDENGDMLRGAQSVLYTQDGEYWVAYGYGQRSAFRIRPGGGRFRRGAGEQGIGVIDLETAQWRPLDGFADVIREPILCMAQASDGTIWFGTDGDGIWRYARGVWTRLTTADGLPSDRVQVIEPVHLGTVWVGTPAGAAYLQNDEAWLVYSEREGLPNNFVEDICVAHDGAVWIATRGGVGRFGSAGWVYHVTWLGKKDEGGTDLVRDGAGTLWAGTADGLYRLEGSDWQKVEDLRDQVQGRFVGFAVDGQGMLWGGTNSHVFRYDGQAWQFYDVDGLGRGIRTLAPAREGGVWLVGRSDIFRPLCQLPQ